MEKSATAPKMSLSLKTFVVSAIAGLCALPSVAGPTPTFSGASTNDTKIVASIGVADADVGKFGNIYIGASYKTTGTDGALLDVVIFKTSPTTWVYWKGGTLPIYSSGALTSQFIPIETIGGLQLYVGYGLNEADMLNNAKYGLVFTGPK